MKYFGESWCLLTKEGQQVPSPVGTHCIWCNEEFVEGDQGVVLPSAGLEDSKPTFVHYHKNCFLRTIIGSLGHQRKQCSCFGGTLEDPLDVSLREAANLAVRECENLGRIQSNE